MDRLLTVAVGLIVAILAIMYGAESCESRRAWAQAAEQRIRADSLAAEAAAAELRTEGWDVLIESSSPERLRAVLDSLPMVRDELAVARVRVVALSRALVSASGTIETRVDTVYVEGADTVYRNEWENEVLRAGTTFRLRARQFGALEWELKPQSLTYLVGFTGDGRGWVQGRSERLRLTESRSYFDLPRPEVVKTNSFWTRVGDVAIGLGVGYVGCRVAS